MLCPDREFPKGWLASKSGVFFFWLVWFVWFVWFVMFGLFVLLGLFGFFGLVWFVWFVWFGVKSGVRFWVKFCAKKIIKAPN